MFKKILLLGYGLYAKQLGLLRYLARNIPLTEMLLTSQISFIFILRLYDEHFSQPGETKIIRVHMYQFKLTKS